MSYRDFLKAKYGYWGGVGCDEMPQGGLSAHDRRFHPHGYRDGSRCKFREELADGDTVDLLMMPDMPVILAEGVAPAPAEEYAAVIAAYTNPDGTKKAGWMKAPNGKPTNLTERQWVQVRTPSFKRWFGDWEKAALLNLAEHAWNDKDFKDKFSFVPSESLAQELEKLLGHTVGQIVITADSVRHIKKHHGDATLESKRGQVGMTAEDALLLPYILNNFDDAVRVPQQDKPHGEKAVEIRKRINGVAIVATVEQGKDKQFVVSGWRRVSAASMPSGSAASPRPNVLNDADKNRIAKDIAEVKRAAKDSSKIVDENGEPMVVYRGDDSGRTVFENGLEPDGAEFFIESEYAAASYSGSDKPEYSVFLDIKKPLDLRHQNSMLTAKGFRLADSDPQVVKIFKRAINEMPEGWSLDILGTPVSKDKLISEVIQKTEDGTEYIEDSKKSMAWQPLIRYAKKHGYDGILSTDQSMDMLMDHVASYMIFSPNQVKSATDNNGGFSTHSNNITE